MKSSKRIVNAKKLLNSKWTAFNPINKEKHFLVTKLITPEKIDQTIDFIELEAVFTKRCQILPWQELNDSELWLQGWI